jgi:hypothetical protein
MNIKRMKNNKYYVKGTGEYITCLGLLEAMYDGRVVTVVDAAGKDVYESTIVQLMYKYGYFSKDVCLKLLKKKGVPYAQMYGAWALQKRWARSTLPIYRLGI